uniref:Uncharacterized protein n=1 Tax=Siphoviridae sp. ctfza2 TaxID=2825599 RepID=A0A8S5UXR4_9CAUD|nr:MAG TPA: hypothetical protein [Siphoviridae sp. ctfza2]
MCNQKIKNPPTQPISDKAGELIDNIKKKRLQ